MKQMAVAAAIAVFVVGLLTGCDAKEREQLRNQVATLEQQLTEANSNLAARESEVSQLQAQVQSVQGERDQAQNQVDKLKSDLIAANSELTKLKAKAKPAATKKKTK
jgi:peptidoglycan hydrolase CwlO-like protein